MFSHFAPYFFDPYSLEPLELHVFKQEAEYIVSGILLHRKSFTTYPIFQGIPVLIKNRVPKNFYNDYKGKFAALGLDETKVAPQLQEKAPDFSFSREWDAAARDKVETIWGIPLDERLEIHYQDLDYTENDLKGKTHLDVGCGNGILCKALADKGAIVFGVDYSTSIWNAERNIRHQNVCFAQADLHYLPFRDNSFDVVYSNGVLHHTANTENAFDKVGAKVKKGGKFYIWLYARSSSIQMNFFIYLTDFMRAVVNKFPASLQKLSIGMLLSLKSGYNRMRSRPLDVANARIDLYDTLTPQYKFYHTPEETKGWYSKNNFTVPKVTHVNPYGFGVLGVKK